MKKNLNRKLTTIKMLQEKKSQPNHIIVQILLLILSIFAYIFFKTKGFGYLSYLFDNFFKSYISLLENIIILLIVFIITNLFIKITKKLIRRYLEQKGNRKDVKLFLRVYGYFAWFFVGFITLSLLFKQIASLITSIGLIGFGVTLALQKPILNFVGWANIVFTKSYKIGDVISINNITGFVYDIRVMYTNLSELNQDGDSTGKSISIPNESVLTTAVINYTKGTNYTWDEIIIYLTYQSNWKKALKIIEKLVQDYYDKKINPDAKKIFKNEFRDYDRIITRFSIYEKGIKIKVRYFVDFNISNEFRTEVSKALLNKLHIKDIFLGKIEDIKKT